MNDRSHKHSPLESERYILYGASFNPPHIGHFSAITQMLENYDKVIVFPYPKNYKNGEARNIPPLGQRMKMLQLFFAEFFPQIVDRLILNNLSQSLRAHEGVKREKIYHTIDYVNYVRSQIPSNVHLSVCLGFEESNTSRKEIFYKENEIQENFDTFKLTEINKIRSEELRQFFSNKRNVKSVKDEHYIRYAVGNSLAEHIFKYNLYGIKKKDNLSENSSANTAINSNIKSSRPARRIRP